MKRFIRNLSWLLAGLLFLAPLPVRAKSYSSGSKSYSSSSRSSSFGGSHSFSSGAHTFSSGGGSSRNLSFGTSRSSSFGGAKGFTGGSGKSYSSSSSWSETGRKSYSSGKSYSSSSSSAVGWVFRNEAGSKVTTGVRTSPGSTPGFAFDTAAARARKQEASKSDFQQFRDSQRPAPLSTSGSRPPPIPRASTSWPSYIPDRAVLVTRPVRIYNVFNPYASRPVVVYRDPYSSLFWWWLLDRSLDDRAWWAYHHRYDMDPMRYQMLLAQDQQLAARVDALEAQQVPRDAAYVPPGLDRDLMYSDRYVTHRYAVRPTAFGRAAFWLLGVPTAVAVCWLFIWLVWFKRWQTGPASA